MTKNAMPADAPPPLRIEEYFLGRTRGWGVFEDRFGTVRRSFTVDLEGRQEDETFVLDESFCYDDGQIEQRTWQIRAAGPDRDRGHAEATGSAAGNTVSWRYRMALAIAGRRWKIAFDDRMILQPDGVLFNRAHMSWYGLWLGTISLFFCRAGADGVTGR